MLSTVEGHRMIPKHQFIEAITAGINRLSMSDADVQWNEKLNGRQFDILATVTTGMYKVLLAFEVKDKSRPVSVDHIEAFVTKAADAHAHKAIFVSTSGYQRGAIDVAKKHGVDLFKLSFIEDGGPVLPNLEAAIFIRLRDAPDEPIRIEDRGEMLGNALQRVILEYADGHCEELPSEPSQMSYYLYQTTVAGTGSLCQILDSYVISDQIAEGKTAIRNVQINAEVQPRDNYFFSGGFVKRAELHITGMRMRVLGGNTRIEISSVTVPVCYENVLTGEKKICSLAELPLGQRNVEAGKFYFLEFPLRYYYCEKVEKGIVTWILVESFQMNQLITAKMYQDIKYAEYYIPMTDRNILARLERRRDYWYERAACEKVARSS